MPNYPSARDSITLGAQETSGNINSFQNPLEKRHDGICCTSLIMSPFVLDRNVPLNRSPKGDQIGGDRDEQRGVEKSRGAGPRPKQAVAGARCESADARQLPTSEAVVEALSGGRSGRPEAPQRGPALEPCSRVEVSEQGAAVGAGEVWRVGGRALRADTGSGTSGFRGRAERRCGNAATMDAGRGVVESGAEPTAAPSSARAQRTLWRDGADGWELSRLAGGAWSRGVLDRHGRRCDEYDLGATG